MTICSSYNKINCLNYIPDAFKIYISIYSVFHLTSYRYCRPNNILFFLSETLGLSFCVFICVEKSFCRPEYSLKYFQNLERTSIFCLKYEILSLNLVNTPT